MIEPTHIVPYGRAATEALRSVIAAAKADNALAPVTVVVASNFVGLSARRLLGSAAVSSSDGLRGIANVSFVTPFQLAEVVGADLLLDTRPITNPVLGAAVRRVLAEDPGPYERVRDHEATEAALAALFAELSNVDEVGIESIAELESSSAQHAVTFYRAIASHLNDFHTEHDLASAAADRPDLGERVDSLGHVVWYLPAPVTPALGRFLDRVLHDAPSSSVILGITGVTAADEPVLRSCEASGVIRPTDRALKVTEPPTAGAIVSVTDAPEEVRVVASKILELAARGIDADGVVVEETAVPFHRIGVFYPAPDPYVRIIEQQFAASGIVANGPDQRRLRDSAAGRSLLAALSLPGERWRRDRVMALVAGGPIGYGEQRTYPTTWDQISRDAGIVRDKTDWQVKLSSLRGSTEDRIADLNDPTTAAGQAAAGPGLERRVERLTRQVADIDQLAAFIEGLSERIQAVESASSWSAKGSAAQQLMVWMLGSERRHTSWPESEQVAFERVEAALVRLAGLDSLEASPTSAVFQRALRSELDVARGRHGRFGDGVLFGPLSSAVGHDLDAVFILGAAEGLLPVPRRDDAVLPDDIRIATMEKLRTNDARLGDDVRVASIDQLETKAMRLQHQHRAFLAALAAAPEGAATLTFPRGSLRASRRALPSRWLLESASALAGKTVYATDFDLLDASIVEEVGSHASGINMPGEAASEDDRDRAIIAEFVRAGGAAVEHPVAFNSRRGLQLQLARASEDFTPFDGNLAGQPIATQGNRPLSSSRLEAWATCGFRYFLAHVLELDDRDDPERLDDISAMDRGTLIHAVLERFIAEAIDNGPPAPSERWSQLQRDRLHEIANEEFVDIEARGRTGRAVHWQVQRDDLHDALDRFLDTDNTFRAANQSTPESVELAFGFDDQPPVEITLGNGRTVAFRGFADRVDVTADGRAIVTDYKSGKGKKFDALQPGKDDVDPVLAGTTLQLGLYAEAAMRHTGLDAAESNYWLVEAPAKQFRGYRWEAPQRERFIDVLEVITDGIDAGSFAAAPGEWDTYYQTNAACGYCTFDSVCVRNRGEQAEAKAEAEGVAIRQRLLPPEPDQADAEDAS